MVQIKQVQHSEAESIISSEEGHFLDLKSIHIAPYKLTQTICALANADGGEVYIGIEDTPRAWMGFAEMEDANGHIQIFDRLFPLGHGFFYSFLKCDTQTGYVLRVEILKSHDVVTASNGKAYLRRGAQSILQETDYALERLRRNKGLSSFETEKLNADVDVITESDVTSSFMCAVLPGTDTAKWLKKQQLIREDRPTVAGAMLFAEEPQALLPKRSGVKIYRYQTKEEGERSRLAYDPLTVEGSAYYLIKKSLNETVRVRTHWS